MGEYVSLFESFRENLSQRSDIEIGKFNLELNSVTIEQLRAKTQDYGVIVSDNILNFYNKISALDILWGLDFDQTNIEIIDLSHDVVAGEFCLVRFDDFLKGIHNDRIQRVLTKMYIDKLPVNLDLFYPFDFAAPCFISGFLRVDGVIKDDVYILQEDELEFYNTHLNLNQYINLINDCFAFLEWQVAFTKKHDQRRSYEISKYYLERLFSKDENSPYIQLYDKNGITL